MISSTVPEATTAHPEPSQCLDQASDVRAAASPSTAYVHAPKTALPAILSTRDLTVLMLLIVLFIANTNGVQFIGPAAFSYWVLGLLTFLVPCAYVTQWLAKRFPGQGAPYLWVTRILGERWNFFSAFCAWLPGVLAVVSGIETGFIFIQCLFPTWFHSQLEQGIGIVIVLLIPTALACLPLRFLKHFLFAVALLYVGVFFLLGIAGGMWLWSGHPSALALTTPNSWQPSSGNFAVYGVIILAFLGADIPLFMGGEIRGNASAARHATSYVWWGTLISFLAYAVGTFGIMAIVPPHASGSMTASVQAISIVFGPLAGNCVAIVLAMSQVALTVAYILLFSRLLVVLAQDRRLPVSLAKINRHGVPVLSIIVQAAAVALVTLLSLVLIPSFLGKLIPPDQLALTIYSVLQAGTTVVWVCTIVQLFVLVPWLLYRRKDTTDVSRFQRSVLLLMSLVGSIASVIGIWATVSSSWLPNFIPNGVWTILVLGVSVISMFIGWLCSEFPRMSALLSEQKRVNGLEKALREQLQTAYNEQEILVLQQQELLTEVDRLYREQAQTAITDPITNLPNHRAIMHTINTALSQYPQSSCAILFVDLDHFKQINDTWGHRAGDSILREIGSRLSSLLRPEDAVGRYGGEEFAILLANVDLHEALHIAERIRASIAIEPCLWQPDQQAALIPVSVTASIGVALSPLHGVTRENLIERADQAMYQAKHYGRNRVCTADLEREPSLQTDHTLSSKAIVPVQTVRALVEMASAHDHETTDHARRMAQLAEKTAYLLGQSTDELYRFNLGALLHDIGKIGIPETILHKPGPLTDDEWKIMRSHPEIGYQILTRIGGVFQVLAPIVLAHHERWDGRGYPHGLEREDIPLPARILSVIDSYDAMTSKRVYKQPMSPTLAKAELRRCAGSQFDPAVVEAFLQVLETEQTTGLEIATIAQEVTAV